MNGIRRLRYLGFDRETMESCLEAMTRENLNLVRKMSVVVLGLTAAISLFFLFVVRNTLRIAIIWGVLALSLAAFFWSGRLLRQKTLDRAAANRLITAYSILAFSCACYTGTFGAGGNLGVTAVWLLLFLLVVFDRPPLENAAIFAPCAALFIACSALVKPPDKTAYDALHILLSLLVGLIISYNKAHMQVQALVADRQLRVANYALYHTSTTDMLTGLPNRRLTMKLLAETMGECRKKGMPLALMVLDVDGFKGYNDRYGHPQGDWLMARLGALMGGFAEENGISIGRIGGEEFMALWAEPSQQRAEELCESLRRAVEQLGEKHESSQVAPVVTVSVGLFFGELPPAAQPERAYELADRALYRAKEAGRNCCARYDPLKNATAPFTTDPQKGQTYSAGSVWPI